jgi:hypothetical protein
MGDTYIYVFYITVRGVKKPVIVDNLKEVPYSVKVVSEYILKGHLKRGDWS